MKLTSAVLALALTAGAPAFAQDMNPAPAPSSDSDPSGLMPKIGHLDVRVTGASQQLLFYVGVGVNADYALLPLGPLALTVGGEFNYDTCFLGCIAAGAILNQKITDRTFTPAARVTLHFPLGQFSHQPVDVYALVSGGVLIATHSAEDLGGQWSWRGTAIGPAIGGGLGGNYMWGNFFFTGTEITAAYTAYSYTPELTSGTVTVPQEERTMSGTNLLVRVFLGLRF